MNMEFQSEHFRLHKLHSMVLVKYKIRMSFFTKEECRTQMNCAVLIPATVKCTNKFKIYYISRQKNNVSTGRGTSCRSRQSQIQKRLLKLCNRTIFANYTVICLRWKWNNCKTESFGSKYCIWLQFTLVHWGWDVWLLPISRETIGRSPDWP